MSSIVSDLCRMCCSSEYMFLYSQHVLHDIERNLHEQELGKRSRDDEEEKLQWSTRIKRLRQEIENPVIWKRATANEDSFVSHGIGQQGEFSLRLTPVYGADDNEVLSVILKMLKSPTVEENSIVALTELILG